MRTRSLSKRCFLIPLLISACSVAPVQYPLNPLAAQVLRPRAGHAGLTHARRVYDEKGAMTWEIVEHDLTDPSVRQELRALKFACNVNGQEYRVAQDLPGLIRESYKPNCFLFFCGRPLLVSSEFIPIADSARLLNAGTVCFSLEHFKFDSPGKLGGGNQ